MKKIITIVSILFFAFSCKKENTTPIYFSGDMEYGSSQGNKNGKEWMASAFAILNRERPDELFGLSTSTYSEEGFLRETLCFGEIPIMLGKFEVRKSTADNGDGFVGSFYAISQDDGDVLEDLYVLDESANNWLEVTFIDTITEMAAGRFDATFKISETREKRNPDNPDVVRFSNGVFDVGFIE